MRIYQREFLKVKSPRIDLRLENPRPAECIENVKYQEEL